MSIDVRPGTVVVYTDIVCAWSTLALHRFYAERERLGLTDEVRVDHRAFLLEDVNRFPIPKRYLDVELPVVGALAPDLGWTPWQQDPSTWPITSAPANEAVHAAKDQSLVAAEQLDMALRLAFFRDSRPISLQHEVLDVAGGCDAVDVDALRDALDEGRARGPMMRDYRARADDVQGSPHFFLQDGSDVHNPGVELHWVGEAGAGFPVVDAYEPEAFADLVRRAAAR
ncbi:DsbA family protein [Cellulomonas sp. NPDC057328]|uniref:DsbA family oxidoreductase n=1 Tax=Cellulomonas sp. NPDC057328 TaxID=3346101 RepID=UPI00363943A0